jgi:Tfp pilus assembly protein PilE
MSMRMPAHNRRAGVTLLELLIILAAAAVVVFIALPTVKPTEQEASIKFAKDQLEYLHSKELQYFNRNGKFAPLSVLAADETLQQDFDARYSTDTSVVEGVVFRGPEREGIIFDIIAELPDGSRYKIDQTGKISQFQ